MLAQDKRRLAKRDGDLSLKALRERGVKPEKVIGLCAFSAGLLPRTEEHCARELVAKFDLKRVARADSTLPEPIA
jgi:glutamyl-tRNA synthetase